MSIPVKYPGPLPVMKQTCFLGLGSQSKFPMFLENLTLSFAFVYTGNTITAAFKGMFSFFFRHFYGCFDHFENDLPIVFLFR
jgi:hypothetical protein